MNQRELSLKIAWSHLSRPYIWGGSGFAKSELTSGSPEAELAFDCSGFMIEIGISAGWFPPGHDTTAQGLRDRFPATATPNAGDLVFWLKNDSAFHVGMVIETTQHYIGADSGGSKTLTVADAIKQDARVKIRPLNTRSAPRAYASPYNGS